MKKYLTTIITAAVLIVAIIGLVIVLNVKNNTQKDPTATDTPETENKKTYLSLLSDEKGIATYTINDVVKLETSGGVVIEKGENGFELTNLPYRTNASILWDVVFAVTSMLGERIDDVEDVSEYGFPDNASDQFVSLTMTDGKTDTLYLGNFDHTETYRYVYNPRVPTRVYKVSEYYARSLLINKDMLVTMKAFTYKMTDTPIYFIIKENGEQKLELAFKEAVKTGESEDAITWKWNVKYPINRESNNDKANAILKNMCGMTMQAIASEAVPVEKLGEYGLSTPDVEYYFYVEDADGNKVLYEIKVGGFNKSESCYYCTIEEPENGCVDVYEVPVGYIAKDINPVEFIEQTLYVKDSDLLSTVEFTMNGKTHVMKYTYEKGENQKEEATRFFDGKECVYDDNYLIVVTDSRHTPPTAADLACNEDGDISNDILTANPYDMFNRLLTGIYANVSLYEIQLEEPSEKGEEIFSVKYTERDGLVTEIKLYKRDDTTAYAYINGEFAGGYVRIHGIFGNDSEAYDVAASLNGVQAVLKLVP